MTVTVSINAIDSNGFIDGKNETSGITISGTATDTVSGGLTGQTIGVTLNGKTYTATVGSNGKWSVSVGSNALAALVDGSSKVPSRTLAKQGPPGELGAARSDNQKIRLPSRRTSCAVSRRRVARFVNRGIFVGVN